MNLSANQLTILQHALGLDEYGRGSMYRNYYATGPEGDPDCFVLTRMGLMQQHPAKLFEGIYFSVTEDGKQAIRELSPAAPKLTRAQQRYRQFLDADCGLTFGEWLRYAK